MPHHLSVGGSHTIPLSKERFKTYLCPDQRGRRTRKGIIESHGTRKSWEPEPNPQRAQHLIQRPNLALKRLHGAAPMPDPSQVAGTLACRQGIELLLQLLAGLGLPTVE
jgi:hypothetical protein